MARQKRKIKELPEIPDGYRPKVLLVGNGINRSFKGAQDIASIIQREWKNNYGTDLPEWKKGKPTHEIWELPFPMQVVAAAKDHVQDCMSRLADVFREMDILEAQKTFINQTILGTGFDAILSTNYSLEFEKSTFNKYSAQRVQKQYKTTLDQKSQQEKFDIYRCTELPDNHRTLLWHIHGTALRKKSLIMGQLYYGNLLSEVIQRSHEVGNYYRSSRTKRQSFKPKSWIDYFLISDVYILGFGLDLSESDIWWLLSYKKSVFSEARTFYFDPNINEDSKEGLNKELFAQTLPI